MKNSLNPSEALLLDCALESERICEFITQQVTDFRRDGITIGLSGGIDSALSGSLSVMALGKDKVCGLILSEKESDPKSAEYALMQANKLGIKTITVDISPILEAIGTYKKRNQPIQSIFPGYNDECKWKMVLPPNLLDRDAFNFYTAKVLEPSGNIRSVRLNNQQLRDIVAATNTKQRTRMLMLYSHAESNNYLVCGTTNKTELMQGFFVQYGDGGVDIEPLAHLYKTQVFQLARHLGVISEIIDRRPTPDTFSFPTSDEEMYFRMPYEIADKLLFAWGNGMDRVEVSRALGLKEEQVSRAFRDFESKHKLTKHLREPVPMLGQPEERPC